MSNRKLLTEVDRLLKKVNEGVDFFEQIFDKIQTSSTHSQREKYETELKKEIKKLQRYRDQIKTYSALSDIKDKKPLEASRKSIEVLMERFKMLEREIKTKAFSKEGKSPNKSINMIGLTRESKVDPVEKEKHDVCTWVTLCVEKLAQQVESMEAEFETLNGFAKNKKDLIRAARSALLTFKIDRHKHHIAKLEIILRMVENDALTVEEVKNIRDDLEFYVEENQENDFEEDEGIYDELDLDDSDLFGIATMTDEESLPDVEVLPPVIASIAVKEEPVVDKTKKIIKIEKKLTPKSQTTTPIASITNLATPKKEITIKYAAAVSASTPTIEPRSFSKGPIKPVAVPTETPKRLAVSYTSKPSVAAPESTPSSLADLVKVFELAKEKSNKDNLEYMMQMVDTSARHVPDLQDTDLYLIVNTLLILSGSTYMPKSVYPTPTYYPQQPIKMEALEKCDLDVLFMLFYYYPDTHLQFLVSKELKKQSWRYHVKYQAWFQRHEEPRLIMEDYEIGVYVYWDYESWGSRKKEEFKFEYQFLEDSE